MHHNGDAGKDEPADQSAVEMPTGFPLDVPQVGAVKTSLDGTEDSITVGMSANACPVALPQNGEPEEQVAVEMPTVVSPLDVPEIQDSAVKTSVGETEDHTTVGKPTNVSRVEIPPVDVPPVSDASSTAGKIEDQAAAVLTNAFPLPRLPQYYQTESQDESGFSMEDAIALWVGLKEGFENEALTAWHISAGSMPTLVPQELMGKLSVSGCYLVLEGHRINGGRMKRSLHYWVGSEAAIMTMGAMAILALELDRLVKAESVTRECQGSESSVFLEYFKTYSYGLEYISSGDTAAVSTPTAATTSGRRRPLLLQLRGENPSVRYQEVPPKVDSLRRDASFILDDGKIGTADDPSTLFIWHGEK
jgi:hypothetical protein